MRVFDLNGAHAWPELGEEAQGQAEQKVEGMVRVILGRWGIPHVR